MGRARGGHSDLVVTLRDASTMLAALAAAACSHSQPVGFVIDAGPSRSPGDSTVTCNTAADCDAGERCNNDYSCFSSGPGQCVVWDGGCDATREVCACDGRLYANACEARSAGQRVGQYAPTCATAPGRFQCGSEVCSISSEYCSIDGDCTKLPAACEAPDAGCDCLDDVPRIAQCWCVETDAGAFGFECTE